MAKYYREKQKKKKTVLARIIEAIILSGVIGIILFTLRSLITSIPAAMIAVGAGAFIVSMYLRPSVKAIWHALICTLCSGIFLLNLTPFVANIYLFEGYKAARGENWDAAIKNYKKALQYDPRDGELNFYTGFAYMKSKHYPEAAHHFVRSLETKLDPSAFNNLGNVYLEMGELRKAEQAYQNALYTRVSRTYSLNNLGAIYQKTGRLDKSYTMFKEALEANPNYEVAKKNLEVVENLRQKYAFIEKRYGEEFLYYFFSAQTYLQYKRADKARDFLLQAADILVEKDKNISPSHSDWESMRSHLNLISQVYSAVGSNLVKLGQIREGISVYEVTLSFRPKNIKQLYKYIASLYQKIGEEEKAREMLQKSQSLPD